MVGEDWTTEGKRQRVERAIQAGAYDTEKQDLYGLSVDDWRNDVSGGEPSETLEFNMPLAETTQKYHDANKLNNAKIEAKGIRSYVFHSGGTDTIVGTRLDGDDVEAVEQAIGDGTVPSVSQIADLGKWGENSKLMTPTPGNPEHVPAPNSEWIWQQVYRVFCRDNLDDPAAKVTVDQWPENVQQVLALY